LGYDTFTRLMDLKYYDEKKENLESMLHTLQSQSTSFVVAGRLNSKTKAFESLDQKILESLVPSQYFNMFTALGDFRCDLSSTELRARGV
jgi:hypothetical protein